MAVENEERGAFSFPVGEMGDLGITSTQSIINAGENFLDGDIDDVVVIDTEKDKNKTKTPPAKPVPPKAPETKTTIIEVPDKEVTADVVFNEGTDEEEEEDAEAGVDKTKTKVKKEEQQDAIVLKDKKPSEVKTPSQATTEDEEPNQDDPEVFYSGIAEEMVKQGIFAPELDDDDNEVFPVVKNGEEFLELFQENARRTAGDIINRFLDSKGPEAREIFDSVISKGVNPREYLNRYAAVQDFKTLDLTQEINQEKVVREFYRQAGVDPEGIDRKIKQHKEYNDLATEAETAQKIVVKKEEDNLKLLATKAEKDKADKLRADQETRQGLAKIINEKARVKDFDGIPLTIDLANEIFNDLTVEKYTLGGEGGQLLTEFEKDILELNRPANHPLKVKLALLLKLIKKDPTLSTLGKKAVSKESGELFQSLKKKKAGIKIAGKEKVTEEEGDGKPAGKWGGFE